MFDIEQLFEPQGFQEPVAGQFLRPPQGQFERPSLEEGLAGFGPVQVYQARFEDYLAAQQSADEPALKALSDQYDDEVRKLDDLRIDNPEFTQSDYNRQLSAINRQFNDVIESRGLMTPDRAKELRDEAQTGVDRGLSAEELPFFTESRETVGANVGELLNRGTEQLRQQFEQAQPPEFQPPRGQEETIHTGTEERDYFTIIERLGLAYEVQQYMMGRYQEFLSQWLQTGPSMPFIDWMREQMRGG